MEFLQITPSNKEVILELFNKGLDKDGFIIEKNTEIRLICPYSKQEIHSNIVKDTRFRAKCFLWNTSA